MLCIIHNAATTSSRANSTSPRTREARLRIDLNPCAARAAIHTAQENGSYQCSENRTRNAGRRKRVLTCVSSRSNRGPSNARSGIISKAKSVGVNSARSWPSTSCLRSLFVVSMKIWRGWWSTSVGSALRSSVPIPGSVGGGRCGVVFRTSGPRARPSAFVLRTRMQATRECQIDMERNARMLTMWKHESHPRFRRSIATEVPERACELGSLRNRRRNAASPPAVMR